MQKFTNDKQTKTNRTEKQSRPNKGDKIFVLNFDERQFVRVCSLKTYGSDFCLFNGFFVNNEIVCASACIFVLHTAIEESETTSDGDSDNDDDDDDHHFNENWCVNCYFYTEDSFLVVWALPKLDHFNSKHRKLPIYVFIM